MPPLTSLRDAAIPAALDALAVLLPVECAGCSRPDRSLCPACRAALLGEPIRRTLSLPGAEPLLVYAGVPYEGAVRRSILAMKEQGRTDIARALAGPLAHAIAAVLDASAVAGTPGRSIHPCPVPQGAESARARGYDPVRMLLRHATGTRGSALLTRRARTRTQKLLGVEQRLANAHGSLQARRDLTGLRLLLIDDVVTSGATLVEAARAAREGGAEVIGAAVVAATPLRHGSG